MAHPMAGPFGGNTTGTTMQWSKVYGGKGVQFYTGSSDFGEWAPIADINEWPEVLELEEVDCSLSGPIIIDREIFGLQEGMVVYVRNGAIYRDAPGTAMVITNRAALVGNASWKDNCNGITGEVLSFMGQLPIIIRGSFKDGDYLLPEKNHCIAISKEDVTFEQYKSVIGTVWESPNEWQDFEEEYSEEGREEFHSVLCATGIK
jgi:hypothetical protein